jgi:hypothetical protein
MSRRVIFKFRLYVAADTLNSTQALANLHAICQAHLRPYETIHFGK